MGALFDDELKKLKGHFMEMGFDSSEQIYQATKSFIDHDKDLARKIVAEDPKINNEEMDLEKQSLQLIALQQPVASDFRQIISILKASTDIERIGDHANTIARETINAKGHERIPAVEKVISEMTEKVRTMLEQVLEAFFEGNAAEAKKIADQDESIDKYYHSTRKLVTESLKKNSQTAQAALSYLMVIRLLERIGDHVVNLAEWLVYNQTGKMVELSHSTNHEEEYFENGQ